MLNRDISRFLEANNIQDNIIADSAEPKSIAELVGYGHKVYPVRMDSDAKFGDGRYCVTHFFNWEAKNEGG